MEMVAGKLGGRRSLPPNPRDQEGPPLAVSPIPTANPRPTKVPSAAGALPASLSITATDGWTTASPYMPAIYIAHVALLSICSYRKEHVYFRLGSDLKVLPTRPPLGLNYLSYNRELTEILENRPYPNHANHASASRKYSFVIKNSKEVSDTISE